MRNIALASLASVSIFLALAAESSAQRRCRSTVGRICRAPRASLNTLPAVPALNDPEGVDSPIAIPALNDPTLDNPALTDPTLDDPALVSPPRQAGSPPVVMRRRFRNATLARTFQSQLMRLGMRTGLRQTGAVWTVSFAEPRPIGTAASLNPQTLLGLTLAQARMMAGRAGYTVRVVSQDGRRLRTSGNRRVMRMNLGVARGRVVRASIG